MDLNAIAQEVSTDGHRWFPKVDGNIAHTMLGLCGEVGEAADLVKKYERYTLDWEGLKKKLPEELIDVLTYTLKLASQIGMNVEEEYHKKRTFNEERFGHDHDETRSVWRNGT